MIWKLKFWRSNLKIGILKNYLRMRVLKIEILKIKFESGIFENRNFEELFENIFFKKIGNLENYLITKVLKIKFERNWSFENHLRIFFFKLASLSFSKALVKVVPNGVNYLADLCAYSLGSGGVVVLGCGGRGYMLVWAM